MLRRLHACFALSVFVYWSTSGCFLAMHLATWRSASGLPKHSLVRKVSMHAQVHVLACATEYRQETAILQRSAARNGISDAARPDSCQRRKDDKRMSQDVKRVWWMKMNERMKSEIFQSAWMDAIVRHAIQRSNFLPYRRKNSIHAWLEMTPAYCTCFKLLMVLQSSPNYRIHGHGCLLSRFSFPHSRPRRTLAWLCHQAPHRKSPWANLESRVLAL